MIQFKVVSTQTDHQLPVGEIAWRYTLFQSASCFLTTDKTAKPIADALIQAALELCAEQFPTADLSIEELIQSIMIKFLTNKYKDCSLLKERELSYKFQEGLTQKFNADSPKKQVSKLCCSILEEKSDICEEIGPFKLYLVKPSSLSEVPKNFKKLKLLQTLVTGLVVQDCMEETSADPNMKNIMMSHQDDEKQVYAVVEGQVVGYATVIRSSFEEFPRTLHFDIGGTFIMKDYQGQDLQKMFFGFLQKVCLQECTDVQNASVSFTTNNATIFDIHNLKYAKPENLFFTDALENFYREEDGKPKKNEVSFLQSCKDWFDNRAGDIERFGFDYERTGKDNAQDLLLPEMRKVREDQMSLFNEKATALSRICTSGKRDDAVDCIPLGPSLAFLLPKKAIFPKTRDSVTGGKSKSSTSIIHFFKELRQNGAFLLVHEQAIAPAAVIETVKLYELMVMMTTMENLLRDKENPSFKLQDINDIFSKVIDYFPKEAPCLIDESKLLPIDVFFQHRSGKIKSIIATIEKKVVLTDYQKFENACAKLLAELLKLAFSKAAKGFSSSPPPNRKGNSFPKAPPAALTLSRHSSQPHLSSAQADPLE
jgi:hypothetical protein